MKKGFLGILGISLCSITLTATATTTTVFEDFSDTLSLEKFYRTERNFSLDTVNQNFKIELDGKAFTHRGKSHRMKLIDTSVNTIEADISVSDASLGNADSQQVVMRVAGTFYNSQSTTATSSLGDVFAGIVLGNRGNGLEAWYEVFISTNDDFTEADIIQGTFGSIVTDTSYPVSLSYDGDNTFTFIFNNGTAVNIDGPARVGAGYGTLKVIGARLRFGENNSTPNNADDELTDDGTTASITGSFDNVSTEAGLVDDFSAASIDTGVWQDDQRSAQITSDGKLKMIAVGQGSRKTARLYLREQNFKSIGVKATFLSGSTNNSNVRPRVRLTHMLGNDTFDIENGATPDGNTGNIWTQLTLERRQGVLRAIVYAARVKDTDWSDQDDLFFEVVIPSINENQEYDLLIDVTGTLVEYKIDGALVHSFDMATDHNTVLSGNVYPYSKGNSGIQARIRDAAGEAHALFDDIRTSIIPISIVLNAQNSEAATAVLPTTGSIFVNEDEVITLTASTTGSSNSVYLWEQTSGDPVEIITAAPRQNMAFRDVLGNGSTFSFRVPVGSNEEDLGFSVSVVNTDTGSETEQTFVLKVDNTESSTIASLGAANTTVTSSSGGGSYNPYLLLFMLLAYVGTYVRKVRS